MKLRTKHGQAFWKVLIRPRKDIWKNGKHGKKACRKYRAKISRSVPWCYACTRPKNIRAVSLPASPFPGVNIKGMVMKVDITWYGPEILWKVPGVFGRYGPKKMWHVS